MAMTLSVTIASCCSVSQLFVVVFQAIKVVSIIHHHLNKEQNLKWQIETGPPFPIYPPAQTPETQTSNPPKRRQSRIPVVVTHYPSHHCFRPHRLKTTPDRQDLAGSQESAVTLCGLVWVWAADDSFAGEGKFTAVGRLRLDLPPGEAHPAPLLGRCYT